MESQTDENMSQEATEQLVSEIIAEQANFENTANESLEEGTLLSPGAKEKVNQLVTSVGAMTLRYDVDDDVFTFSYDDDGEDFTSSEESPPEPSRSLDYRTRIHVWQDYNNCYNDYRDKLRTRQARHSRRDCDDSSDSDSDDDGDKLKANKTRYYYNTRIRAPTIHNDMVPIGLGTAKVSLSKCFDTITWGEPSLYAAATRKLMFAVFSRETMATHCLPNNPFAASPNTPDKKPLDMFLVGDIVCTVVRNCKVPPVAVRKEIAAICEEERKIFEMGQNNEYAYMSEDDSAGEGPSTSNK